MNIEEIIESLYLRISKNDNGNVADYIPQLKQVNPDLLGISYCNIKGRVKNLGDWSSEFSIQSCSKPLNYCLARQLNKNNVNIHKHVGYEPSGRSFNEFVLNKDNIPHNPLINSGAIMIASFLYPDDEPSVQFENVKKFYECMSGRVGKVGFDNSIFLSEKRHADRNISLAYHMRENKAFYNHPTPNRLTEILDLYFQCCSITINCENGSIIAATLANKGICPISGEQVIEPDIVKDCLSLMFACGMYDFSGQFAFQIGLPAKSGVSGCLMLVIPNVGGICIWSPRLDDMGNTVRGVDFCKEFAKETNYHYHIFNNFNISNDTTESHNDKTVMLQHLITAASKGDLEYIKSIHGQVDLNSADYDGRTALHLAASDGHLHVVEYLLHCGVKINVKDRWGNTPLHEASKTKAEPYLSISKLLSETNPEVETMLKCGYCDESFEKNYDLEYHEKKCKPLMLYT